MVVPFRLLPALNLDGLPYVTCLKTTLSRETVAHRSWFDLQTIWILYSLGPLDYRTVIKLRL